VLTELPKSGGASGGSAEYSSMYTILYHEV